MQNCRRKAPDKIVSTDSRTDEQTESHGDSSISHSTSLWGGYKYVSLQCFIKTGFKYPQTILIHVGLLGLHVLTTLFFPKPLTTFFSHVSNVRGEKSLERKFTATGYRTGNLRVTKQIRYLLNRPVIAHMLVKVGVWLT